MKKDEKGSSNNNAVKSEQQDNNLEKKQQTPAPSLNKLILYTLKDDAESLQEALSHPAFDDKSVKQEMLQTLLIYAAGSINTLKKLITLGADVKKGAAVLLNIIEIGSEECLLFCLDKGADIEVKGWLNDGELCTPLHHAIYRNSEINLIKILLEYGANPETANRNSKSSCYTPMTTALYKNLKDHTKLFLINGARGPKDYEDNYKHKEDFALALNNRQMLLAFYGDPKLCGNYKTRNVVITNLLTMLTTLPIELVKLVLDYDICIFTLETMIPTDEDLALFKAKQAHMEVIDECPICCDELNDENTKQLPCPLDHKICKKCFADARVNKCPHGCEKPIK